MSGDTKSTIMAEIKIEKKKPIWPWILLLAIIVIAAILYFMNNDGVSDDNMEADDIEEIDDTNDVGSIDDTETSDAFVDTTSSYNSAYSRQESDRAMMDYRSSLTDSMKIGADVAHTQNTLLQLVKAVEIKANQFNIDATQNITDIKQNLDTASTTATTTTAMTSQMVKSKAGKIVDVIKQIQQKQFPGLSDDVMKLRMSVDEMQDNATLTQQRTKLQSFFNNAADLLNNMNI
ncbi:hypothetical protein SAMN03097699_1485 [Flavobacteriaceae bacterium MAR_2010_188]|nr:hypothetical protein SAMN03097699_1485 [Flavobacteriaceae bacterium MAR_2010_188]